MSDSKRDTAPMHNPAIDRKGWPAGPWDQESDKMQWTDTVTDLPCLIVRNRLGALCGYVGVTREHPWYGKSYHDIGDEVNVHGGLTFSGGCQLEAEWGICHVPEPGTSEDVWWFGFDCAHMLDVMPGDVWWFGFDCAQAVAPELAGRSEYRSVAYVRGECSSLAAQIRGAL